jgi:type I restriction enzyme, S subunit
MMGKYLMMCIASPFFTTQLDEKRSGSAQPQIPAKTLKTFVLPIPPLEEQHEIVRRLERLFAFGERLEARWRAAQGQVSALTPSLLAKAFRGELVGREEGDEQ